MPTELIEALTALAGEWDTAAPAITLEELTPARWISNEAPPTSPEVDVLTVPHRRRHWWIAATVAAAFALVVVAVTVVGGDPDRRIQPPVDSGATPTSTTAAATTTTTALTQAEQLVEIQRESNDALSRLGSFAATVTNMQGLPPSYEKSKSTNRVTVMADGSMWSEGDTFEWSSFDASTGVARNVTTFDDASTTYQEVAGWNYSADATMNVMFGSPVMPWRYLYSLPDAQISVAPVEGRLGRSAWRIDATSQRVGFKANTESWWIDEATGLVVEYQTLNALAPASLPFHWMFDDLATDVELPPAFPGTFPDGAKVNRVDDPNGFRPVTVAEAAAAFGRPLAVPADLPKNARVLLAEERTSAYGSTEPIATFHQVTIEIRKGFTTTRVSMAGTALDSGQPAPKWMAVVDGWLCPSSDGRQCVSSVSPNSVATGALAGLPMSVGHTDIEIVDGAVSISVSAPDDASALATAASLRLVGP